LNNIDRTVQVAIYQKAKQNNYYCGDSYFYTETDSEFVCALADGLGSGEYAKESSQAVIDIIRGNTDNNVEQLVKKCNQQLVGKRGVVLGILKMDFSEQYYSFSSIGNIGVMTVKNGSKKRNIPNAGYLAGYPRQFKVIREKLEPKMNFFMFSDGVLDMDLSQKYFFHRNVLEVVNAFGESARGPRTDDTTLIAMKYKG
jgi:negative regulator of sigma-B (phosphoserine phosphatase)